MHHGGAVRVISGSGIGLDSTDGRRWNLFGQVDRCGQRRRGDHQHDQKERIFHFFALLWRINEYYYHSR